MPFNAEQFLAALSHTDFKKREEEIQKFIDDHHMSISVNEVIAFAQMVCKIGQPFFDDVCPVVNVL